MTCFRNAALTPRHGKTRIETRGLYPLGNLDTMKEHLCLVLFLFCCAVVLWSNLLQFGTQIHKTRTSEGHSVIPTSCSPHAWSPVIQVYVLKRPHVDEFLKRMGELFECVLFTASLAKVGADSLLPSNPLRPPGLEPSDDQMHVHNELRVGM